MPAWVRTTRSLVSWPRMRPASRSAGCSRPTPLPRHRLEAAWRIAAPCPWPCGAPLVRPEIPARLLDIGAVSAAPLAAESALGQECGGQHEEPGFRIQITRVATL